MTDSLNLAIADLCDKAVVNSDVKLLCWAFALPEQMRNERWLPVDVCSIISKYCTHKPVEDYKYPGSCYILAPDIRLWKLERDNTYPGYSAMIKQGEELKILFRLIDGELRPMSYIKDAIINYSDLSVGYTKHLDGTFVHWIEADGFVINFVEGGETARTTLLQVLDLKYEFPGIWFDEPLNDTLADRVYDACMAFGAVTGMTITRNHDRSIEISEWRDARVIIRKLPDGEFEFAYTLPYGQAYEFDREELQAALIALVGGYL